MILIALGDLGAQSATPSQAVACDAPPRSTASIAALLARDIATPAATTGGTTLPEGPATDPAFAAEMEGLVRRWLDCQNAGEPLRAWALFSDGYLHRLLSRTGDVVDSSLATPTPITGEAATLVAIEGERVLPDGRFGATVTIAYPSVPMPKRFFFYFTEEDGRLLIDGILGEISFSVP